MSAPVRQAGADAQGRHLVLYDGVCGLCSRLVQWVLARDRQRVFSFASLQSPTGSAVIGDAGGRPGELDTFYVVEHYRTAQARVLARSAAALFVAGALGWPWKAVRVFGVLPAAWLDRAYDLVARNRYRIFGRHDACLVPRPEHRDRFVD